jgi:uncharacterized protein YchJ
VQLVDDSQRAHCHARVMRCVMRQVRWLRLKVLGRDSGTGSHEDEAFVAFQTWFKFKDQQGQRQRGTRTETLSERRCASAVCLVDPQALEVMSWCKVIMLDELLSQFCRRLLCSRFLRDAFTGQWQYVDGETDWKAHDYAADNQY